MKHFKGSIFHASVSQTSQHAVLWLPIIRIVLCYYFLGPQLGLADAGIFADLKNSVISPVLFLITYFWMLTIYVT